MAVGETLNIFVKISGAGQFGKLNKAISTSNASAMKLNKSLKTTSVDFGTIAAAAASLGAVGFPVKAAADYETAVTDVARAVEMTSSQQIQLSKNLMAMHGGSVEELSEIAAGLGRAGVKYRELAGVTQVVAKGVTALGMSAEHTTDAIASITNLNQWEMTASIVGKVGDLFAHLENTTAKVKAADLANVWGRAASSFKTAGIEAAESQAGIAAWAMSMSNSPELAGSMIKQFIKRLPDASREFAKLTGQNVDFYKQLRAEGGEGIINIVNTIKKAGLDIRGVQKVLSKSGAYDMFQRLSGDKAQKTLLKSIENASQATGAMDQEFSKTMSTFNYQLSYLKKQFTNLLAIIGEPMMSALKPVLQGFSGILKVFGRLITMFPNLSKYFGITAVAVAGLSAAGFGLALSVVGASKAMGLMRQSLGIMRFGLASTMQAMRSFSAMIMRSILYTNSLIPRIWALVSAKRGLALSTLNYARLVAKNPISMLSKGIVGAISRFKSIGSVLKKVAMGGRLLALPLIKIISIVAAIIGIFMLLKKYWRDIIHFFRWTYNNTLAPVMGAIYNSFVDIVNFVVDSFGKKIALALKSVAMAGAELLYYTTFGTVDYRKEAQAISLGAIEDFRMEKKDFSISEGAMDKFLDSTIDVMGSIKDSISGAFSSTMDFVTGADGDEAVNQAKALTQEMAKNAEVREEFLIPKNKTTGKAEIDVNIGLTDELKMQAIEAVTSRADLSVKVREIALTQGV